jgi:hypothetical protein
MTQTPASGPKRLVTIPPIDFPSIAIAAAPAPAPPFGRIPGCCA